MNANKEKKKPPGKLSPLEKEDVKGKLNVQQIYGKKETALKSSEIIKSSVHKLLKTQSLPEANVGRHVAQGHALAEWAPEQA